MYRQGDSRRVASVAADVEHVLAGFSDPVAIDAYVEHRPVELDLELDGGSRFDE